MRLFSKEWNRRRLTETSAEEEKIPKVFLSSKRAKCIFLEYDGA